MKISAIQLNSGGDIQLNLENVARLVSSCASSDSPDLIALPEYFSFLSGNPAEMQDAARNLGGMDIPGFLGSLARDNDVSIHAGSSLVEEDGKFFNQSFIYNQSGELIATYRKVHLFDTVLPGGKKMYESDFIDRGHQLTTYDKGDFRFGCSICFDIRYPEHYARLVKLGANVLLIPSAFTYATGAEHWEVLLRARAIESQCYVVAPAQVLSFSDGKYMSWGHSMIVDPWGTIVAQASEEVGYTTATISIATVDRVRKRIPVQANRYWGTDHEQQ